MVYLWKTNGDPLVFLSSQPGFGANRSALPIVSLPQVFYRYFKMFMTVTNHYQLFTTINEFTFTAVFLVIILWAFRKIKLSYWLLAFLFFLIPTLTGTLLSMPRYVLLPFALLVPVIISRLAKYRVVLVVLMVILQIILLVFFTRGYWVA